MIERQVFEKGPDDVAAEIEAADAERLPAAGEQSGYGLRDEANEEIPLGGYAALLAGYGVFAASSVALVSASRVRVRDRMAWSDLLLAGVATHKLARIVTKDWVTSPIRAPFVAYAGDEGSGEVKERPRGRGLRRAIGALLTCPWCIAPWIALPMIVGLALRPKAARWVAGLIATVTVSDALQIGYQALKRAER